MVFSKHNIFSKIHQSDKYYIVNLLSGNADILEAEHAQKVLLGEYPYMDEFIEKGYLVDTAEEQKLYREKYLQFIDDREEDEIQIFFVAGYGCNFNCSYCYQEEYTNKAPLPKDELFDAFFQYVNNTFAGRKKYITLFGGEPLMAGEKHMAMVESFAQRCKTEGYDLAIVTNGYMVEDYLPVLKESRIREIQITLDGVADMHDSRRPLHSGGRTFEKVARGVDLLLQNNIPVNLRMVVDKENINDLPKLANYAIEKGWTKSPNFKTQLGRNYELHTCQQNNTRLFTRLEMYADIYNLIEKYPEILEFHKPAYSISKYLFENGELPGALFDSCPGTKTEWAFDYTGKIYSCTATVGKEGEELGTFYPKVELFSDKIEDWEDRDVLSIEKCKDCSLQLACGGGCASVAKNNTGKVLQPDCRPVQELIQYGIALYGKEFINDK